MAAQAKAGDMAKGGGDQKSDQRGIKKPGDPSSLIKMSIDKDLAKNARALAAVPPRATPKGRPGSGPVPAAGPQRAELRPGGGGPSLGEEPRAQPCTFFYLRLGQRGVPGGV